MYFVPFGAAAQKRRVCLCVCFYACESLSLSIPFCVCVCGCARVWVCACVFVFCYPSSLQLRQLILATQWVECTCSLAPFPHSLASLTRRCVRSLTRWLTHSLPSSWDNGIFLSNFQCVLNHSGMTMKLTHRVPGHSLVCSLVRSHCTLIHFLPTARALRSRALLRLFIRSLARPFTRSPIHSLPSSWERGFCL